MKLVIDIPEEEYEFCKKQWDTECLDILTIAVKYGKPLPERHGRLIDEDNYKDKIDKYIKENKTSDDLYLAGCGDRAYHSRCMPDDISALIEAEKESE